MSGELPAAPLIATEPRPVVTSPPPPNRVPGRPQATPPRRHARPRRRPWAPGMDGRLLLKSDSVGIIHVMARPAEREVTPQPCR
jgi:hypothetical protein